MDWERLLTISQDQIKQSHMMIILAENNIELAKKMILKCPKKKITPTK